MRLIFLNRYYWPDESATSLMLTDLASSLAENGWDVTVLTSRQLIDDAAAQLPAQQMHGKIAVRRLYTTRFGRGRLAGRALDYLSFYFSALWALLTTLRRGDIVVAKTDPPLLGVVAAFAAFVRRAKLVNWLQDVYPEVAVGLGVFSAGGAPARVLGALRDASLRAAALNVAVGERMRSFVQARAGRAPVQVAHNWPQDMEAQAQPARDNPYRRELGVQDKVVFAYSGNLGRAHQFDALLAAAKDLKDDPRVHFLIVGSGAQAEALQRDVRAQGLNNWSFLPPQPRGQLNLSLAAADVHLVSLNPLMEGLIVPSKLYGILAAARPTLFMGDADGEVARLLREYHCGLTAPAGDAAALKAAMRKLADDAGLRRRMGEQARSAHEQRHARAHALRHWQALLREVAGQ